MLYLIGIGLWDEKDISLKGVDAAKNCDAVYLEQYTGIWHGGAAALEKTIGKKISVLEREKVESNFLINEAKNKDVALLIPGDPLAATTHFELFYQCKKQWIECIVIHASSIYTAIAITGLQLYKFGRTTTLAKPHKNYIPESPYDVITENKRVGLHTLVLLDTAQGGMTIKEGVELLQSMEEKRKEGLLDDKIIAAARLGSENPIIRYGHADDLLMEEKPAVIIIPGTLNFKEEEALGLWL
ncbi:MAG: diphthine synthase [Candidatus Aenigmarchaeota archaeon]|nr:diphthine synthase [Candidatus Aenigmarchaeota archaeon]